MESISSFYCHFRNRSDGRGTIRLEFICELTTRSGELRVVSLPLLLLASITASSRTIVFLCNCRLFKGTSPSNVPVTSNGEVSSFSYSFDRAFVIRSCTICGGEIMTKRRSRSGHRSIFSKTLGHICWPGEVISALIVPTCTDLHPARWSLKLRPPGPRSG